jgi:hypothetical protein
MNIFLKSFSHQASARENSETEYLYHPPQTVAVLLSATCIKDFLIDEKTGEVGRSNCPLFHGSLAPKIFGKTDDDNTRRLLLKSNNITWIQTVFWDYESLLFPMFQKEMIETLSKTRYSSKSLKEREVFVNREEDKQDILSFLQTGGAALKTLEIGALNAILSLKELASIPALTNSLNRLVWSHHPIPDSQQLQHFNKLQEFRLYNTSMDDEELIPLKSLKNLRRLELVRVSSCSGSFLDVVCPWLETIRILEIRNCKDLTRVSGLMYIDNLLEELTLVDLPRLAGHEKWKEFPLLKIFTLGRVSFDHQEKFALSSDAFSSLDILDLNNGNETDPFHTKILEGCQRKKSSKPIKEINIHTHLEKEGFEALFMVPVEELNLDLTWTTNHIPLDILWSEEKIITKTLKKFKWWDFDPVSSISFLKNCKQLEFLELPEISSNIDLSPLANLPLLKELSLESPYETEEKEEEENSFMIKDLFRSAHENNNNNNNSNDPAVVLPSLDNNDNNNNNNNHDNCENAASAAAVLPQNNNNDNNNNNNNAQVVVLPSLEKLELMNEKALSRFEGLENILPNLRILVSSARVDERENDENLLNSFLYVVRNFPKLEEIRFNGKDAFSSGKFFKPMHTRIPRLLKKEKPNLIIYYPSSCQYESEPEKEGTRRDRE